jgi:uncharacterized membrane protein YoaK (UPF0700 family)
MSELRERARVSWPWAGSGHGPLPALLVVLTVVTGLVDSVSYVALGHVFVANMTGNVVFIGFAAGGAPGLSLAASVVALGAFLLGALVGGRIGARVGQHRGRYLRTAAAASLSLVLAVVVVAGVVGMPVPDAARYALITPLALAMGIQNAMARRLAVPDLTTTVLTLTLTGIAADSRLAGGTGGHPSRRITSLVAMLIGALIGALLVINVDLVLPLAIAALLIATASIAAHTLSQQDSPWARPP